MVSQILWGYNSHDFCPIDRVDAMAPEPSVVLENTSCALIAIIPLPKALETAYFSTCVLTTGDSRVCNVCHRPKRWSIVKKRLNVPYMLSVQYYIIGRA